MLTFLKRDRDIEILPAAPSIPDKGTYPDSPCPARKRNVSFRFFVQDTFSAETSTLSFVRARLLLARLHNYYHGHD